MVNHCDKCGTELNESQARYHRYYVEDVHEDSIGTEGELCGQCLVDFEEWLATEKLTG